MDPAPCPRCGTQTTAKARGRPRPWCSDRCRKLASEEHRAAARGAIGLEIRDWIIERRIPEVVHRPPSITASIALLLADVAASKRAHELLTGLHQGSIRLEHSTLDGLPQRKAVEHLRALLISTGILPPDPGRELRWLENGIPELLGDLNAQHHQITTRWIRWAVLPRLRRLAERGHQLTVVVRNERRKIEQVVVFLLLLEADSRYCQTAASTTLTSGSPAPERSDRGCGPFWSGRIATGICLPN